MALTRWFVKDLIYGLTFSLLGSLCGYLYSRVEDSRRLVEASQRCDLAQHYDQTLHEVEKAEQACENFFIQTHTVAGLKEKPKS